jgi:hypothetical protein
MGYYGLIVKIKLPKKKPRNKTENGWITKKGLKPHGSWGWNIGDTLCFVFKESEEIVRLGHVS